MGFSPAYYAYRKDPPNTFGEQPSKVEECLSTSNNAFCVARTDGQKIEKPGDSTLRETIKQLCVFEEGGLEVWYDYITEFTKNCFWFDTM